MTSAARSRLAVRRQGPHDIQANANKELESFVEENAARHLGVQTSGSDQPINSSPATPLQPLGQVCCAQARTVEMSSAGGACGVENRTTHLIGSCKISRFWESWATLCAVELVGLLQPGLRGSPEQPLKPEKGH